GKASWQGRSSELAGDHRAPRLDEAGERLAYGARVLHLNTWHPQTDDGRSHHQAVVLVGVEAPAVQLTRVDAQPVGGFADPGAQPAELGRQRGEPVGFVTPQV